MSALPAELRNSAQGERWVVELDRSLDAARTALARRKTLAFASTTLWAAILLSCAWVALVRFTLLDIPQWPALLFPVAWLGLIAIVRRTRKVGIGESARYLDKALGLDERVATSLEMVRSAPVTSLKPAVLRVPRAMLDDTAFHLKSKREQIPSGLQYNLKRWQYAALGGCMVLLLGAILLPTPLDQVRAERAELQRAVNDQIAKVEALRTELTDRPNLDAASKAKIEAELQKLLDVLNTPQTDRSAILAAIADTQERLHNLSPQNPTDFLGVVAAAKTVQNATVAAARNAPSQFTLDIAWSPEDLPELSDLGRAADAATTLKGWIKNLNSGQLRALSTAMERAQSQAVNENANLGQHLLDSSQSIASKDVEKSGTDLQAVSDAFLAADKQFQLAGAVDKALADLDDSRQTLAKAGADGTKKNQVGFRRPGAPEGGEGVNKVEGTPAADGSGSTESKNGDQGVNKNEPSAFGQQMGNSSPDYSSAGDGQTADTTSGQGGGGSVSSSSSTSDGQTDGQSGGIAGGGTGNTPGTFGGQSTGVVGGSGGAISQVSNPEGQGVTTGNNGDSKGDQVYIPPTEEPQNDGGRTGSDIGAAPASSASGDNHENGLEGRAGENNGDTKTVEQRGTGVAGQILTPYKEVYGDYAKEAGQALEGVYIPADAKDYVREYFTELGK